jgi:hypothetical protein
VIDGSTHDTNAQQNKERGDTSITITITTAAGNGQCVRPELRLVLFCSVLFRAFPVRTTDMFCAIKRTMHQRLETMLQLIVQWPTAFHAVHTKNLSTTRYHQHAEAFPTMLSGSNYSLSSWYFHDATVLRCIKRK